MDPLVELLDRQVDFLLRQEDSTSFLIQVGPFLRALRSEPRLAAYLDDVLEEVVHIVDDMEEVDAELTAELVELRHELVALWPEADDSNVERPSESGSREAKLHARLSYSGTLAFFDDWAASEPQPFNADGEGGLSRRLLGILHSKDGAYLQKLEAASARDRDEPETEEQDVHAGQTPRAASEYGSPARDILRAWRSRLGNVHRRHDHAVRLLKLRTRTSAGVALLMLEAIPDQLNPPPRLLDDRGDDRVDAASDLMRWMSSESYSVFKLAWRQGLDAADHSIIGNRVAELRDAVDRLGEELRRRIGITRSRVALVDRFRLRCEWHDRNRMLAVADDDRLPGAPEDRLTNEFARYLFDAGLSPLTKALAAELQTDLIDPAASFYVEAKQYASSSARADIVKSVAQVLDTVARLRGTPYAVDEAFCVIFRRDGPYYDLPDVLQTETYRLRLVLVDLAPTTAAGRRQREKPVQIRTEEFFAADPNA